MLGIIIIGISDNNIKSTELSHNFENNVYIVDKNNCLSDNIRNEVFEVTINNGVCSVRRTDLNSGWNFNLIINADLITQLDKSNNIPVLFINLEKEQDRLEHMENLLYKIFSKEDVYRIDGVKHEIGREGCRLAHINANLFAINNGFNYYVIAEDDIQPLVDIKDINKYIYGSIDLNPDLVLFEQGQDLERRMNLELDKTNPHMYRIFSGGNNTGCYMCSKNFGIKLIKHWINKSGVHCDYSWQELWKSNNIYFHRPQIFHQKEGYSNQNDISYRQCTRPFDWAVYDKLNL